MRHFRLALILAIALIHSGLLFSQNNSEKKFSAALGGGYFNAILAEEGVTYSNATYAPEIGAGFSYFLSFDYHLFNNLHIGVGYNGSYAGSKFIKGATIENSTVDGYLEAGAIANSKLLLNLTYALSSSGISPYAKLGIGYFQNQVEMGDVPLELTNNVELELFPDYKYSGFGIMPEVGLSFNSISLSLAYSLPFDELEGEMIQDVPPSVGKISSNGFHVNLAYRISLF